MSEQRREFGWKAVDISKKWKWGKIGISEEKLKRGTCPYPYRVLGLDPYPWRVSGGDLQRDEGGWRHIPQAEEYPTVVGEAGSETFLEAIFYRFLSLSRSL